MMEKTQNSKPSALSSQNTAQKTLLHFFQRQTTTTPPIEKVSCPACSLQVPQSKINWHLDHDCKSKIKQKKDNNRKLSLSKKDAKLLEEKSKAKARKQAVLSDSEDEEEILECLNLNVNNDADQSDSDSEAVYISSSMVEAVIVEDESKEGSPAKSVSNGLAPSKDDGCNVSPYFSPDSKSLQVRPLERQEKVVPFDLPKLRLNNLSILKSDWDSPESSPEKVEKEHHSKFPIPILSPQTASAKAVMRMLDQDWKTPENSPQKGAVILPENSDNPITPIRGRKASSGSDSDFEPVTFSPNTPKTPTHKSPKSQPSKVQVNGKVLDDELESSSFQPSKNNSSASIQNTSPKKISMNAQRNPKFSIPLQYGNASVDRAFSDPENKSATNSRNMSPKILAMNDEGSPSEISTHLQNESTEQDLTTIEPENNLPANSQKASPKKITLNDKGSPSKISASPQNGNSEGNKALTSPNPRSHAISPSISSGRTCGSESEQLFSPVGSSVLVTPVRSPSPPVSPPPPVSSSSHIRNLFPSDSPNVISDGAQSSSKVMYKVNVSSSIQNTVTRVISNSQSSSNQNDLFDSLSQGPSQNSRAPYRSPRKFYQGLKKTGLLENASQNLSRITPRKKQTKSDSVSSSPEMLDGSHQSPSKDTDVGQQKTDPARYRHMKGYYLENFLRILDTVMSEPQDVKLFNEEDLAVIKTFHGLTLQAQKLYVRLFQRKIKWNKVSKIEYREICDSEDTQLYVNELVYSGYLHGENDLTKLDEVLSQLSSDELNKLCKLVKVPSSGSKENMMNRLLKFSSQQRTIKSHFTKSSDSNTPLMKKAKEMLGRCCLVVHEPRRVLMRVLLLYGLPRYDDDEEGGQQAQLTTLLMVNMGKMKFPQYSTRRTHAIFRSRDDLLKFEEVSQLQVEVQESVEAHRWSDGMELCETARQTYHTLTSDQQLMDHDRSLPKFLRRFTCVSLLVYLMTCGVECRQRMRDYNGAVEWLQELLAQTSHLQDYRGRWYDRLALNLQTHLKKPVLAVKAIGEAMKDPEVRHGHRLSLSIRAERLAASMRYKSLAPKIEAMELMHPREAPKVIIEGRSLHADIPGYKRMFIRQDSDRHAGEGQVTMCSVEELAVGHYNTEGYPEGLHREGTTVNSLFGVLFWDVLYADMPDVFRSPHQAAPLDLDDSHFYSARKEKIEARLSEMQNWTQEEADNELTKVWTEHMGEVSLVAWDIFRSLDHLKGLVSSLGLPLVAAICERLARDHRFTRSGFPDLIVWNPVNKISRIVEVKGPNDRLSTKQILWLDYLLANGAVAEVCHVEAIGAKKMKRASPRKVSPKKKTPKKSPKKSKIETEDEDSEAEFNEVIVLGRKRPRRKEEDVPAKERNDDGAKTGGERKEQSKTDGDVPVRKRRKKQESEDHVKIEGKGRNMKQEREDDAVEVGGGRKKEGKGVSPMKGKNVRKKTHGGVKKVPKRRPRSSEAHSNSDDSDYSPEKPLKKGKKKASDF